MIGSRKVASFSTKCYNTNLFIILLMMIDDERIDFVLLHFFLFFLSVNRLGYVGGEKQIRAQMSLGSQMIFNRWQNWHYMCRLWLVEIAFFSTPTNKMDYYRRGFGSSSILAFNFIVPFTNGRCLCVVSNQPLHLRSFVCIWIIVSDYIEFVVGVSCSLVVAFEEKFQWRENTEYFFVFSWTSWMRIGQYCCYVQPSRTTTQIC